MNLLPYLCQSVRNSVLRFRNFLVNSQKFGRKRKIAHTKFARTHKRFFSREIFFVQKLLIIIDAFISTFSIKLIFYPYTPEPTAKGKISGKIKSSKVRQKVKELDSFRTFF